MADREYVITFKNDKAQVRLPGQGDYKLLAGDRVTVYWTGPTPEYHVIAPSARRAEQIARVMKGQR